MAEIVVADTSPFIYLHHLRLLDLLPRLYTRVLVPPVVVAEIEAGQHHGCEIPPLATFTWVTVRQPVGPLPEHAKLHPGEREAIALALETGCRVLIDDHAGRSYLHERHHPFTGTLGVLVESKKRGFLTQIGPSLDAMVEHGFWLDDTMRRRVLELAGET